MSSLEGNPFAALFNNVEEAQAFVASQTKPNDGSKPEEIEFMDETPCSSLDVSEAAKEKIQISQILEEIFLFTLDDVPHSDRPSRCVFLSELQKSLKGQDWLDIESLEQAVFERLMLDSAGDHVITTSGSLPDPRAAAVAGESNVLRYLHQCCVRLQNSGYRDYKNGTIFNKCKDVMQMNGVTCFLHQEFFPNLKTAKEFVDIFMEEYNERDAHLMESFFLDIFIAIATSSNEEEDEASLYKSSTLFDALRPLFEIIHKKLRKEVKLGHQLSLLYCDMILYFTKHEATAKAFLTYITPKTLNNGKSYENSLLGCILSLSCIPQSNLGPYEFFDRPSRTSKQEHDRTEATIQQPIAVLNEKVYQMMYNMLKLGTEVKHQLLDWLGNLFHANSGRAKLWTRQMAGVMDLGGTYCSDGFFINLCAVMLRLSKPFAEPWSPKLLKVQPSYCMATCGEAAQVKQRNIHMKDISKETGLIPSPEGENEQITPEENYNFLSECFHMTHFCLHLGFHVAHERFVKLNQELHRVQQAYRDVAAQGAENSEPGQRLKEHMEKGMTMFLCLKAALSEPRLLEYCFNFNSATATYLIQLSTVGSNQNQFEPVKFPLSETAPDIMCCVPEFVAENIVDYMLFTRRFKDSMYETMGEKLESLLTFILVFMGSPERMRNPHMRAHMAEGLEALMPPKESRGSIISNSMYRDNLFKTHPHIKQVAPVLFNVFVSIEMTGQGVEFEQKFNYRRPMYAILEFLWGKELHKNVIQDLSKDALEHIEDINAPLFLRFINLLINDAIFLLDEALSYMNQIKEKQKEQDSGAWKELEPRQKQEQESNLRQVEMLARFHNIMGRETIHTLELFTQEIKNIFSQDIMVDRMAAMLNYFLLHLVGPKQKELKVRDADKFEFKPHELVSNICQLYLNLGEDDKFCLAVSMDGRSYSHELFVKAENVLTKIHRPGQMVVKLHELGLKVKDMAEVQKVEEEAMEDAPEEYLDPIMGTLMKDPVLLPSSGQIVDRTTIARHVLSDQFDPFNRSPLTMDMVKPEIELRQKILSWLDEKRALKMSSLESA